jgi:iron complex outermembrane recepter protein
MQHYCIKGFYIYICNIIAFVDMKTFLIYLTFILGISHNISSQNIISGTIKDSKTKESLIGATVYLNDLKKGTITDNNGVFKIENVKAGNYLLEISSVGYKSVIERVSIAKNLELNYLLSIASKELTEIVVTGVARSTELKLSPIIIKAIDKNSLNQNSSTNIVDALKNIPGISQITTGTSISKPIIRGLGYNRVISLYNGIRQEGQQWGDEHGLEIDENDIDRIEIVKGPGSLMYGSDGIAGVLNFISPKAPNVGKIATQVVSNYQTNNNLIAYSLSNAGNIKDFQWLSRLTNKNAGNYQNAYDGKVYNSGFQEFDGSLFVGINKNWGHSHFHFNTFNTTLNLVEGERDSLGRFIFIDQNGSKKLATNQDLKGYQIGFPHQKINHFRFLINNYFLLKKGTLNVDLGFQSNKRREFGDATKPQDVALYFNLSTLNYNLRYNLVEMNGWETSVGLCGMYQYNKNNGLEFIIPEYNLFDVGSFIFTQKTFNQKITIAGGIRYDNRNLMSHALYLDENEKPEEYPNLNSKLKFKDFNKSYQDFSGSVGLSLQLSEISTLKLNFSRGFRTPNIAELSSNGRHEGTFRYEIGNQNLKSELSHQIDLAYFLNSDHVSFELTPFVNFISNFIYASKLQSRTGGDSIPDISDPSPAFQFIQRNANLLGAEVFIDLHPHPLDWLHIGNSFSYVQATQNNQSDSTKYLPFIPAAKYRGELKAEFKKFGTVFSNIYVKFGIDHFFKQDQIFGSYDTETITPAYTLLGVGVGANVKMFKKNDFLKIFLNADNLMDIAYQNHLSRLKYAPQNLLTRRNGVYNMGRNFSCKVILGI